MTDNVLFLGEGEMKKAEIFHLKSNKLKMLDLVLTQILEKFRYSF